MTDTTPLDDYDNPWKTAIDGYLPEFMAFYFPQIHADIDWSKGYESLDNELPALVRDAELGNRYADKLVKVITLDGQEDIVYIHIEVQGQQDAQFNQRMYTYNYRIYDKFGQFPVSLAVLADENEDWKPTRFSQQKWGCGMEFTFPVVKLTDYEPQLEALQASDNAFAILTAAHILTKKTKHQARQRYETKLKLIRLLYQKGWDKQELINFLAVIDWLMHLPEAFAVQLRHEVHQLEEEDKMRYVTSFERLAMAEGRQEGMQQGMQQGILHAILSMFSLRFPQVDASLYMDRFKSIGEAKMAEYGLRIATANTPDEVFAPDDTTKG